MNKSIAITLLIALLFVPVASADTLYVNETYWWRTGVSWDVSTASYLHNFSITAQDTALSGVFFKSDGTKMYVTGRINDSVNEYDLSSAWNVSTALYLHNFSVASQDASPHGMFFKSDGTKMYFVGNDNDSVNEYDLSSAWNVSTASYLHNFSVATQEIYPMGISFKNDGTKMYVIGNSNDSISEYDLSSAWNVSTASYLHNFSITAQDTVPTDVFFKSDGSKMYVAGDTENYINEYDLSSAWNVSTALYLHNFSVATQDTNPTGVFFKSDGSKMYVIGYDNGSVNEYGIGTQLNNTSTTIQHAVDNASSYDTVYIYNGSYTENIDISTAHLTIQGEGSDVVNITATSAGDDVFEVTANYTNITGTNVSGSTNGGNAGIKLGIGINNCNVFYNKAMNNFYGINLYTATSNTIADNTILENSNSGIILQASASSNTLTSNNASDTVIGIALGTSCNNNILTDNIANSNSNTGITLTTANNTLLTNNTANSNNYGTTLTNYAVNNTLTNHTSSSNIFYDYFVYSASTNNTLLNCDLSSSSSMMNDSTSQWYIKYDIHNNITNFNDTTINQTVSPTNVTTTIQPTAADYVVSMTTLPYLDMSTGVETVNIKLVSYTSGGHSDITTTSTNSSEVLTINIGIYPVGSRVQMKANGVNVETVTAGASGIATFTYSSGFSEVDIDIDPSITITLNDTTNYTYTVDSYDASAFTSALNLTWNGNGGACAVSVQMPLITTSGYTGISYDATNTTTAVRVSNISSAAFCNFTIAPSAAGSTYINLSPATAEKTSNLPVAVAAGLAAGTITVIIFLRRRRR